MNLANKNIYCKTAVKIEFKDLYINNFVLQNLLFVLYNDSLKLKGGFVKQNFKIHHNQI